MGRVMQGDITVPYQWTPGDIYGRFLGGLKNKKILGIKCDSCKKVYCPPQDVCPVCYEDFKIDNFVEVGEEGEISSFTVVFRQEFPKKPSNEYLDTRISPAKTKEFPLLWQPETPYAIISVRLKGADTDFFHIAKGATIDKLAVGKKVKAVWKENTEGYILDIDRFEVISD